MFIKIPNLNVMNIGVFIALCGLLFGGVAYALSVDEGFDNIPWGSTPDFVKNEATGALQKEGNLNYHGWNHSPFAKFTKGTLAPQAYFMNFTGKYAEVTQYFFSKDKLCLVIHRPPYTKSFDAAGYVQYLELKLDRKPTKKYRGTIPFPNGWGRYNMKTEYPLTVEWENDTSLVRVAVEAWPLEELREIKNVIYSSKNLMASNAKAVEAIQREKDDVIRVASEERAKAKLAQQKAIEELQKNN